jgi:hypothetical protein
MLVILVNDMIVIFFRSILEVRFMSNKSEAKKLSKKEAKKKKGGKATVTFELCSTIRDKGQVTKICTPISGEQADKAFKK